ncbi:taurine transport system ATP-binding protein [Spirochaetota bacterium]|nr:taurine transport system ATP-binding protein [Spirochaetota bacterium]
MNTETNELVLDNIDVTFSGRSYDRSEDVHALSKINLTIKQNDFIVALGASGCGKTTLLNVIAGFLRPTEGSLYFQKRQGRTKTKVATRQEIVKPSPDRGVVFQKHALLPWFNVIENVEFALKLQGVDRIKRREIAEEKIVLMGLEEFQTHKIYELSGGMQQRVGIARALASDPAILLMDEPLGALDALTRETVQEIILKGWEKTRKMVFFITHSVEEALFMATRLIIMSPRPGRITHEFKLDFSKQFLKGVSARKIKSQAKFIAKREKILDIIHSDAT